MENMIFLSTQVEGKYRIQNKGSLIFSLGAKMRRGKEEVEENGSRSGSRFPFVSPKISSHLLEEIKIQKCKILLQNL
jgi:hypothetical protein